MPLPKNFPRRLAFWIQIGYVVKMKKFILISLCLLVIGWGAAAVAACPESFPLFRIERSKNKNIIQYDICASNNGNGDVPDPTPVKVYWILENGRKADLNVVQNKFAYGILSQKKLGEDRFEIVLVALKDRKIIIERIAEHFGAIVTISGKQSILEKVFVKSEERVVGWPKVHYVDLFGRSVQTNASVKERIIPQ